MIFGKIFTFIVFLNDENFKGEVEQTNFCDTFSNYSTIILLTTKNPPVKIWSNKFQMVMINYSKLCASLQENLMSEFYVN